uniref:Homing endonuclease LAGLIDADG domain-containing protein n=1 Tax=Dactylella sp. TaxID=1814903 RepID=A0A482DQT0_9PEZI|nr:hypothetical protein [Dactylella sp.]
MVRVRKNSETKIGWSVEAIFSITLHHRDLATLNLIQQYFGGIGTITKAGKNTLHYRVVSAEKLTNVIIPHFVKYPLITQKGADFILFKQVVDLINQKKNI